MTRVQAPTADELKAWSALPFDEEEYREAEVGSSELTGEPGYSVLERTWARPTLDVHGMPGGFTGAGAKTVIPAKAMAKVSLRLVPEMTPAETFQRLKEYVATNHAEGGVGRGAADPLGRSDRGEHGQRVCAGGDRGECMRSGAGRRCLCAGAGRSRSSGTSCAS